MTTFGYNLAGQLTSIRDPENNDTTYTRDLLGRVTREENELGASRYFVYDAASNLTLKKDRNARLTAYSFDDLNRLESENWLSDTTSLPSLAVATTTQGGPVNGKRSAAGRRHRTSLVHTRTNQNFVAWSIKRCFLALRKPSCQLVRPFAIFADPDL